MPTLFDADNWLLSLNRTISEYVMGKATPDLYEIQMEYPSADKIERLMPLEKSIIHFEIDALDPRTIGFGDSEVARSFDDDSHTIMEEWAKCHEVNFDVGAWVTAATGGVTARWGIVQFLDEIFHGPAAEYAFEEATGNVQILSWRGGHHVQQQINDIDTFRMVGSELVVRCYSRVLPEPQVEVGEIVIHPHLSIAGDELEATGD